MINPNDFYPLLLVGLVLMVIIAVAGMVQFFRLCRNVSEIANTLKNMQQFGSSPNKPTARAGYEVK